jgi:hypothetical protein
VPSINALERKLQISRMTPIFPLVVEELCLLGRDPVAFLIFAGLGGLSFLLGTTYYLLALVRAEGGGA